MPFQDSSNLNNMTKYVVDANGDTPYATVQAAIDAANTAGEGLVYVRQGTYTEDLTLYDNVMIQGMGLETIITGVHTPPNAGSITLYDLTLTSPTDILESAGAGTTDILFFNCLINTTNGFTCDLVNWTGAVTLAQCADTSTLNGVINNTGGMGVAFWDSQLGAGAATLALTGGTLTLYNSRVVCAITIAGACAMSATMGSSFANTVTIGGTSTATFTNSYFETAANQALVQGSAGGVVLNDVTIDCTNPPPVGGAGAGNLTIGSVTFVQEDGFAGTLTLNRATYLDTGTLRSGNSYHMGLGAGAQNVIDITPDTAIGGVAWRGVDIDGAALDPTAANSTVYALNVDLSGVAQTNDPDLRGLAIEMPATAGQGCDAGIRVSGYGINSMLNCSQREAGFYTDGTLKQDADITAFTAVDTGFSQLINVDLQGSTGGDFHAYEVTATGVGTADVFAIGADPQVGIAHQHTGTFGATAQSWKFNGGYTDVTAAFDNPAVDVTIFDNDDDYIYIGANAVFSQIRVILNTVATRDIFPTFEYSTAGPTWVPFTPVDATQGFTENGIISFDSGNLAGWAAVNVNGANHFYVRIRRTRNNIGTIPIEDTIRILEPVEYYWNEDGDILAASVTANGLADTTGTQYEILTFGAGGTLNGIGPLTDGQLVIGDTGGTAVAAALASADGTVAITNGAGTIDLSAPGGALPWSVETGAAVAAAINSGYIANRAGGVTCTIPTTAAVGSVIRICSIQGLWTIAQNAGESIVFGAFTTTVGAGGSLVATNVGDTIEIVCTVADTTWSVLSSIGNITVN